MGRGRRGRGALQGRSRAGRREGAAWLCFPGGAGAQVPRRWVEGRRGQPWAGRAGVFGGGLAVPLLPPPRAAAEKPIQGSVCPWLAVPRTSCLQGQLASKHLPKPLSFLRGDATKPLYSFLQPLPARGIPWPGPRIRAPHAELR